MGSNSTPLHIIDDDDEGFDWEAAVLEIDVACSRAPTTTTEKPNSNFPRFNCDSGISVDPLHGVHKKGNLNVTFSAVSSSRQSTLDKFISIPSSCLKKPYENGDLIYGNGYKNVDVDVADDEGAGLLNGFVEIDPEAAKTWIYPVNVPRRDYQFSITRTALFSNTLVVLPTGLGKTLIAAAVMYNYFRWFPQGKIVFAAPSRPLVMQQIEACHKIVGIPQEWTIDLTGQINPTKRAVYWKDKRIFFVTPQVLEKDIDSGSCLVKHLVCLVIDEAHRATGNYSYCVAVNKLISADVQLRILALSATPGSKKQIIQNVIDNLRISTLEYRNESDLDVVPYVHERKLELIEVPMGNEADQINNLILEAIRPLVTRLCSYGVLQNRDLQTFSPYDLLKSRDRFRQEPPLELSHAKSGDIEGCFGVLITLYHVRKLLSSHGIRPAFEMLEEKLKEGNFARLMSRNENLLNAKLVMQQTLTHGATSPKLAKLLEVLIDHFRGKDPKNSRVIIFSHFRGSVRDIMDALASIGESVKATEFIGQSSGKNLKGQSQKVQQAVLQKFRSGGYNVIVATSIGEEGLDIMEVDLVICFDANISPLRMIQRMGRTGRKNEGRVVVLACEGAELKGYMKKKANSKAIKKHMDNGGMSSFSFHPSPRMIPHIFKPEVQYIEMSIDEFVPRGKKLKDDNLIMPLPFCKTKLTDAETDLLAKYFVASGEVSWRPSLIAFPHFQTSPCHVKKVAHSSTTGMLIDTMQYLQGLRYSQDSETLLTKDKCILDPCLSVDMVETSGNIIRERLDDTLEEHPETEAVQIDVEIREISRVEDIHIKSLCKQKPRTHTFMFGSEFVSLDALGNVLVLSLPQLPFRPCIQSGAEEKKLLETSFKNDVQTGKVLSVSEKKHQDFDTNGMSKEIIVDDNIENNNKEMQLANESSDDEFRDAKLSPRLTSFIENGVVPESPISKTATWTGGDNSDIPARIPSQNTNGDSPKTPWKQNDSVAVDGYFRKTDVRCSSDDGTHIQALILNNDAPGDCESPILVSKETQTPCTKVSNMSSSKDWMLPSEVKSETVEQQCKFRRLRKHADLNREIGPKTNEQNGWGRKPRKKFKLTDHDSAIKLVKGQRKKEKNVTVYIDEEAEIASDNMASDDDEDGLDDSSYEDSFIDDGTVTHPTSASTQAACSKPDMMAVYRRSLLSQSPYQRLPNFSTSPDSLVQSSKLDESISKDNESPQVGLESTGRNSQFKNLLEDEDQLSSRKRKLSYYQNNSVPMVNLETKFSLLTEAPCTNLLTHIQTDVGVEEDDDDHFFEGIDFDAIEQEAVKQTRSKADHVNQKAPEVNDDSLLSFAMLGSASFDLGI